MAATLANPWYAKLKELYDHEPFQPFVIRTEGGQAVRVRDRELVMFHPRMSRIHVSTKPEYSTEIEAKSVKAIEVEKKSKPAGKAKS
jgi:hypothetical protein